MKRTAHPVVETEWFGDDRFRAAAAPPAEYEHSKSNHRALRQRLRFGGVVAVSLSVLYLVVVAAVVVDIVVLPHRVLLTTQHGVEWIAREREDGDGIPADQQD